MKAPETVLARWSRRKLEASRRAGPSSDALGGTGKGCAETEAVSVTRSDSDTPVRNAVDPATLPPIEAITAGTDIRAFLRSSVPLELTRSALRRAWTTDPAIRDFIGIAENQWDFNDPTGIPGFGPLRSSELATLAGPDSTIDRMAQVCSSVAPGEDLPEKIAPVEPVGAAGDRHAKR